MPTLNRSACAIEFQQASTVWADSVRPPSNTVNDAIRQRATPRDEPPRLGSRSERRGYVRPLLLEKLLDRKQTGLQHERVERRLGQQNIDAPFDERVDLLVIRLDHLVERDRR